MDGDVLHVMRLDVLLWSLGGFVALDRFSDMRPPFLPQDYILAVKCHVLDHPVSSPYGSVKLLAERHGRSVNATRMHISTHRRGMSPMLWNIAS